MSDIANIDFQLFSELSPVCQVYLDQQKQLIWGNEAWRQYTGYDESADLLFSDCVHPEEQQKVSRSIDQGYENARRITIDFLYRRHDGEYRPFQLVGNPKKQDEQVNGMVCVLSDMTDQMMIEEQMLALNDSLESMVTERTSELQKANNELKSTQSQMLQNEKMASIGQLAAGVAHEINNPMGFIFSNLGSLRKYITRINGFIEACERIVTPALDDNLVQELKAERKKSKVDYLIEDSDDLISESLEGAERVREIVRNLKSFSRVDRAEEQLSDINECLESTIGIVWNELKYKVTLEKDYGDLPPLSCHSQQLNQVFMNLLVNASQAIDDKGTIWIRTFESDGLIKVEIRDDGCGISEENLTRVFEPFFTTKEVGKGTGLGMSISFDIVRAHGGQIGISSKVGEGTTFTVSLPVKKELID